MKSINFDEGYKKFIINGDESRFIRIRLSDPNLMYRIDNIDDKIQELKEKYKGATDSKALAEFDRVLKALLNETFGTDVCTPVFGDASVLTFIPGTDKLILSGFLEAFLPIIKQEIENMAAALRPEVQKYIEPEFDVDSLSPEQKQALLAKLQ